MSEARDGANYAPEGMDLFFCREMQGDEEFCAQF
jgi:hypothetical protein